MHAVFHIYKISYTSSLYGSGGGKYNFHSLDRKKNTFTATIDISHLFNGFSTGIIVKP